ncbi:MAG: hypothetical protein A2068_03190 [Ignavibacteria bacterium GWB2_35_6b]|nr:MAG: hypothetical protein A2068_03190 [Ignavibacteria bacterium GWB2_35_6b]
MKRQLYIFSLLVVLIFSACSDEKKEETILARVGDKTISLNEFLRRAEYTIRPAYCRNNSNIDKKIILNSLIAEKLLSIEAGNNNSFITGSEVKMFLQGRLEQAMRQFLYNEEIKSRVKIDTNKINNTVKYAGREYDVSYVSLNDTTVVKQLTEEFFHDKAGFEKTLSENYNLKQIPEKKIIWNNLEHPVILNTLFTRDYKKNDIIGPVKIEDDHYMFIKIKGWIYAPDVAEKQIQDRYNMVKETYEKYQSRNMYENYIRDIMKGKNLNFNKNVFFALTDIFGPLYLKNRKEKEELFKNGIWNYKNEEMKYQDTKPRLDQIRKEKLFTIDGEIWTVDKFLMEIKKHPLVFRSQSFPNKEFGLQFQLAILDLVRDKYLTAEAYKKGFDKLPEVVRDNQMWSDNINALNKKYRILQETNSDSLFSTDHLSVLEKTLNPKIDYLQRKYSDKIFINTEIFNKIKLTKTDMAVTYSGSPFPQVVPNFPVITSDYELDYGNSMK